MTKTNILVFVVSSVVGLFLIDKSMSLMGFPSAMEIKVAHPKNHHSIRKNIEFEYEFSTNSQGLRYQEISLVKPAGERRILVLGDSFTEGWGIKDGDRFTDILERQFSSRSESRIRFINGGLAGTGPLEHWEHAIYLYFIST